MSKRVNITDKLEFNENPILVIGNMEVQVNADAETMIRLVGAFSEDGDIKVVGKALNLIFSKDDVEKICSIRKDGRPLSAKSLMTIIEAAMDLVMGENQGE